MCAVFLSCLVQFDSVALKMHGGNHSWLETVSFRSFSCERNSAAELLS